MTATRRATIEAGPAVEAGPAKSAAATRRGTERRREILRAALGLFVEQGVAATTVGQIRAESGASTGSIYHLFGGKALIAGAVYAECMRRYQEAFIEALDRTEGAEHGVKEIVRFQAEWCRRNPLMARFLFTLRDAATIAAAPADVADANARFFAAVGSWWRAHAHYGGLRRMTVQQSYALWLGPVTEVTRHWLTRGGPEPGEEDLEVLADGAWRAVGRADPPAAPHGVERS
jgi:AcrR family transcriptional regulator